jgi:hypothetical protein
MSTIAYTKKPLITEEGREGFLSDWREAFVISGRYGMGDPLARSSPVGAGELLESLC